jgi:hypothetical protein
MKPTLEINRTFHCLSALAAIVLAQPALAAVVFTQATLNITSTGDGSEILNNGTLVEANHFGNPIDLIMSAPGPVTLGNGLTFSNSTASFALGGTGFGFHSTASDAHGHTPLVSDAAFDTLAGSYIWIAYGSSMSTITIPSLTIGQEYRLQMISFEPSNALVTVEGEATNWTNSLFTATWTATDTVANIQLDRTAGEIDFNGYALHAIPEPAATLLGGIGAFVLLRRRRHA